MAVMAAAMAATVGGMEGTAAATDTARGLLMLSPRLLLDTAMAVTAVDMVATAVVVMEVTAAATATARGRLSPATAMAVMAAATAAMAATAGAAATATGVSY